LCHRWEGKKSRGKSGLVPLVVAKPGKKNQSGKRKAKKSPASGSGRMRKSKGKKGEPCPAHLVESDSSGRFFISPPEEGATTLRLPLAGGGRLWSARGGGRDEHGISCGVWQSCVARPIRSLRIFKRRGVCSLMPTHGPPKMAPAWRDTQHQTTPSRLLTGVYLSRRTPGCRPIFDLNAMLHQRPKDYWIPSALSFLHSECLSEWSCGVQPDNVIDGSPVDQKQLRKCSSFTFFFLLSSPQISPYRRYPGHCTTVG